MKHRKMPIETNMEKVPENEMLQREKEVFHMQAEQVFIQQL